MTERVTLNITQLSPSPLVGEGVGEGDIQYPPPPQSSEAVKKFSYSGVWGY
jgi:hypothetical protein